MSVDQKGLLGIIGLCKGAGRAVVGVPMICEELKRKANFDREPDVYVIEASDTSSNTHKRITDKCAFYNARHIQIEADCEMLGHAVGKSAVAAVMINDPNFCRALEKKLGI